MLRLIEMPQVDEGHLRAMDRQARERVYALAQEVLRRNERRKLATMYPDSGPLSRGLYQRHMEFFRLGERYRQRLFLAANRVGKTEGAGGYEMALHLTGLYPDWWEGRRFDRPVSAWSAGDYLQNTRDTVQYKLLGQPGRLGTGLIPGEHIIEARPHPGSVPDAKESVTVRHVSGGVSRLVFKSYEQGRKSFQGTEQDVIWLDEEPPMDVYTECLTRTMTTNGMVMLTFTPLMGMSEVVLSFLPGGKLDDEQESASRAVVTATWDDVPHLGETEKREMLESYPPHQRDARSKGIPMLGAGAVYTIPEEDFLVDPFPIPPHWPMLYGMDVGWNCTASVWGAHDLETDTLYIFDAYHRGQAEPEVHVAAIKARGEWIPGVIDPASRGRAQNDGTQLLSEYIRLGLQLQTADNAVEAGIHRIQMRLSTGRLRVFRSLTPWLAEYRLYRRADNGKVIKERDHLMDATRYLVSRLSSARGRPVADYQERTARGGHVAASEYDLYR